MDSDRGHVNDVAWAQNDDGLFDICIVHEVNKARIFTLISYFFSGAQFGQKEVQFRQANEPARCRRSDVCDLR